MTKTYTNHFSGNKLKIKTAGKILTEEDIENYMFCGKLYSFGGERPKSIRLEILQDAYEALVLARLKKPQAKHLKIFPRLAQRSTYKIAKKYHLHESDIRILQNESILFLAEIVKTFPLDLYEPIIAKLPFKIKINKSLIEFNVSGAFRTKRSKTIHYVTFSHNNSSHSQRWNLFNHLKSSYLEQFLTYHNRRVNETVGHVFSISQNLETFKLNHYRYESSNINKKSHKYLKQIVSQLELGHATPRIPCSNMSCAFRSQCYP